MRRQDLSLFASALLCVSAISAVPMSGQTAQTKTPAPAASKPATANQHATKSEETDGERVFQQNCSRCHATPDSIPPSIAGTVARHMRVRAGLSKKDEEALLKFLNPF